MRLTESNPLKDFVPLKYTSKKPIFLDYDKGDTNVIEELLNKLGQLEDIEDKLGIDLITLFKALENGVYYTNYGRGSINYCDKPKLIPCYIYIHFPKGQVEKEVYGYDFIVSKRGLTLSLKTYKQYWALTKEELK